eukprot:scaffold156665_cov40-Tisochrysis_lutea.AAC.1
MRGVLCLLLAALSAAAALTAAPLVHTRHAVARCGSPLMIVSSSTGASAGQRSSDGAQRAQLWRKGAEGALTGTRAAARDSFFAAICARLTLCSIHAWHSLPVLPTAEPWQGLPQAQQGCRPAQGFAALPHHRADSSRQDPDDPRSGEGGPQDR